jgi:hypothetical protein
MSATNRALCPSRKATVLRTQPRRSRRGSSNPFVAPGPVCCVPIPDSGSGPEVGRRSLDAQSPDGWEVGILYAGALAAGHSGRTGARWRWNGPANASCRASIPLGAGKRFAGGSASPRHVRQIPRARNWRAPGVQELAAGLASAGTRRVHPCAQTPCFAALRPTLTGGDNRQLCSHFGSKSRVTAHVAAGSTSWGSLVRAQYRPLRPVLAERNRLGSARQVCRVGLVCRAVPAPVHTQTSAPPRHTLRVEVVGVRGRPSCGREPCGRAGERECECDGGGEAGAHRCFFLSGPAGCGCVGRGAGAAEREFVRARKWR